MILMVEFIIVSRLHRTALGDRFFPSFVDLYEDLSSYEWKYNGL